MAVVRRATLVYLVAWTAGAQLVGGLLLARAPLPPVAVMLAVVFGAWPLAALGAVWAAGRSRPLSPEPGALGWLSLAGVGAYGYWTALYFATAALAEPSRVAVLPDPLAALVPFEPAWALVYVGVHPLSLVPSFALRDARLLGRHVLGHVALVTVCAAAWIVYPVGFPRPALPPGRDDLGAWVLGALYARDPVVGCLPSTHAAVGLYAASALGRVDRRLGLWALGSAVAIDVSTLFVKEHYLVDVVAGVALGLVAAWLAHGWRAR